MINEKIASRIGAVSTRANIALRVVGQKEPIAMCSKKVNVQIECATDSFTLQNVIVVEDLAYLCKFYLLKLPSIVKSYS